MKSFDNPHSKPNLENHDEENGPWDAVTGGVGNYYQDQEDRAEKGDFEDDEDVDPYEGFTTPTEETDSETGEGPSDQIGEKAA